MRDNLTSETTMFCELDESVDVFHLRAKPTC